VNPRVQLPNVACVDILIFFLLTLSWTILDSSLQNKVLLTCNDRLVATTLNSIGLGQKFTLKLNAELAVNHET
jgi:hypothetical protein